MAKQNGANGTSRQTVVYTRESKNEEVKTKRDRAQTIASFAKELANEVLQRDVNKNFTKSFTQYTKDLVKTYITSPNSNQDTLREISRFLCRNSMIYKKLIMYYASAPLFHYNITPLNGFTDELDAEIILKNYESMLKKFNSFDLQKEGYSALYLAIRDGFYVGYTYYSEDKGIFTMPLDTQYCRIYGKNQAGQWVVYFNAKYFDTGNNKEYINGTDGKGSGAWDKVFIDGYNAYEKDKTNAQWFKLPPEKTLCLITCDEDEFAYPLPFFLPLFVSLLDLLDLEQIIQSKNELENYKLIVSKIPLVSGSDDVDDFALSVDMAKYFNKLLEAVVPDLIGVAFSPMDIDTVSFENSNSTKDTDSLADSIKNLFNNAGASQIVVAGGESTNSVGLNHAIQNDEATLWVWIKRLQSWLNYFISKNISENFYLDIHKITWYNRNEYLAEMKDYVSFGADILGWLTAKGDTPYIAYQKLRFERALGLSSMFNPLQTSYTLSSNGGEVGQGRDTLPDDQISDEGIAARDKKGT